MQTRKLPEKPTDPTTIDFTKINGVVTETEEETYHWVKKPQGIYLDNPENAEFITTRRTNHGLSYDTRDNIKDALKWQQNLNDMAPKMRASAKKILESIIQAKDFPEIDHWFFAYDSPDKENQTFAVIVANTFILLQ